MAIGLSEGGSDEEKLRTILGDDLNSHVEATIRVGRGQPTEVYARPLKIRMKEEDESIKNEITTRLLQSRCLKFVRRDFTRQELAFDRMLRVLVKQENEEMRFRCFVVKDLHIEFTSAGLAMKEALESEQQ